MTVDTYQNVSVQGDVRTMPLAPHVTRTDVTVRLVETQQSQIKRFLGALCGIFIICISFLALLYSSSDYSLSVNTSLKWCVVISLLITVAYIIMGGKKERDEKEFSTVSIPSNYFTTALERTIKGASYQLKLSEQGEVNLPASIVEGIRALDKDIPESLAQYINSNQGDVTFIVGALEELYINITYQKTKNGMPALCEYIDYYGFSERVKASEYDVYLEGEKLKKDGKYYIMPSVMLTTAEMLRTKKHPINTIK